MTKAEHVLFQINPPNFFCTTERIFKWHMTHRLLGVVLITKEK